MYIYIYVYMYFFPFELIPRSGIGITWSMFLFNILSLTQTPKDLLDAWERYAFLVWDRLGIY